MPSIAVEGIPSTENFDQVRVALEDREFAKKLTEETGLLCVLNIQADTGDTTASYVLDLKNEGTIANGTNDAAEVIITMKNTPFKDLCDKKTSAKWLIFTGKAKRTGSGSLLQARLIEPALRKAQEHYVKLSA